MACRKVAACSREEDKTACCFGSCVNDVKPRALDLGDVYQQVEVQQLPSGDKGFKAVAVAADGIPPHYLRKKGWKVNTMASSKRAYDLAGDAQGVDSALRRRMPDLDDPGVVVVGRWYVPFMFVKADGDRSLKDQFRRCMFYKMTMEQSWEQIYNREAEGIQHPPAEVAVTATVRRSTAPTTRGSRGWRGVVTGRGGGTSLHAICWWRGSFSGGWMAAWHSPVSSGTLTRLEPSGCEQNVVMIF